AISTRTRLAAACDIAIRLIARTPRGRRAPARRYWGGGPGPFGDRKQIEDLQRLPGQNEWPAYHSDAKTFPLLVANAPVMSLSSLPTRLHVHSQRISYLSGDVIFDKPILRR